MALQKLHHGAGIVTNCSRVVGSLASLVGVGFIASTVLSGCGAADAGVTADSNLTPADGPSSTPVEVPVPQGAGPAAMSDGGAGDTGTKEPVVKLGVYFMDGTIMTSKNNGVIWRLANRTGGGGSAKTRYFNGPGIDCDLDGTCKSRTETMISAICEDLTAHVINAYAVFGYSRGVFIANRAANLTTVNCPALLDLPLDDARHAYFYAGFLDGVRMSTYLTDDTKLLPFTKWHHIHRKNMESLLFPVSLLSGGIGDNEGGPDLSHGEMGMSEAMATKVAHEANTRTGIQIFIQE